MENDKQYREDTVAKVRIGSKGWEVQGTDGWSLFVTNSECQTPPKEGETLRYYGRGIGSPVRGIVVGGRTYRYQTEAEQNEDFRQSQRQRIREMQEKEEEERPARNERIARLPEPLRERMEWFGRSHTWRAEYETYELGVCEEAESLSKKCGSARAVRFLKGRPYGEQVGAGLSDGHSGNSAAAVFALAEALFTTPNDVPRMHGALCPLVGCKIYGCWAAEKK